MEPRHQSLSCYTHLPSMFNAKLNLKKSARKTLPNAPVCSFGGVFSFSEKDPLILDMGIALCFAFSFPRRVLKIARVTCSYSWGPHPANTTWRTKNDSSRRELALYESIVAVTQDARESSARCAYSLRGLVTLGVRKAGSGPTCGATGPSCTRRTLTASFFASFLERPIPEARNSRPLTFHTSVCWNPPLLPPPGALSQCSWTVGFMN